MDQDAIHHVVDRREGMNHSNGAGPQASAGDPAVDLHNARTHSNSLEPEVVKLLVVPEGGPSQSGGCRGALEPRNRFPPRHRAPALGNWKLAGPQQAAQDKTGHEAKASPHQAPGDQFAAGRSSTHAHSSALT